MLLMSEIEMVAMNNVDAGNAKYRNNDKVRLLPSGLHMI
jgi:hypothetical protein